MWGDRVSTSETVNLTVYALDRLMGNCLQLGCQKEALELLDANTQLLRPRSFESASLPFAVQRTRPEVSVTDTPIDVDNEVNSVMSLYVALRIRNDRSRGSGGKPLTLN